jgi:hypothetical protein
MSCWLPTAAARVMSCGICGGQSGTGFRFSPNTLVSTANHPTDCPRKSTRRESRETGIPNVTVWRVLRKRLHLDPRWTK